MGIPKPKIESHKIPEQNINNQEILFHFSLSFWSEIDYFGIGDQKSTWFSALFDHLRTLGGYTLTEITSNPTLQDRIRFHKVNWNAKKIPIKRTDIPNIPEYVIKEEQDMYQFQISKANGRVVGFFDYQNVFQIVLFDPKHNIHPSKDYGYSVNKTRESKTHYDALLTHICNFIGQTETINCTNICEPMNYLKNWITEEFGTLCFIPINEADQSILLDYMELYGVESVGEVIDYVLEKAIEEIEKG